MTEEIDSGIWQVLGSSPNPHHIIPGGVHGDEKTGIAIVNDRVSLFASGRRELASSGLKRIRPLVTKN